MESPRNSCWWPRGERSAAGPAAYAWFPWLPEDYLVGLRGRCSGPEAGLGDVGTGRPRRPCRARARVKGPRRGTARGSGRKTRRGAPRITAESPPAPCPAEAGRAWGRRAAWPVRGSGRGPDAGRATPIGHALCPQASWPCCAVQAAGPQVWDGPLSSLRAGREVTAGRSRASPSGRWGGRREAVSS